MNQSASRGTREWMAFTLLTLLATALVLAVSSANWRYAQGAHANLFAAASFSLPLVAMLFPGSLPARLIRSAVSALYWPVVYYLFVSYQNHPWFAQMPPGGCDGPCWGWYTFEFEPPFAFMLVAAGLGLMAGITVYFTAHRFVHRRTGEQGGGD